MEKLINKQFDKNLWKSGVDKAIYYKFRPDRFNAKFVIIEIPSDKLTLGTMKTPSDENQSLRSVKSHGPITYQTFGGKKIN